MGFGSAGTLTIEDLRAIEREVPAVAAASPEVRANAQVAVGNQNLGTSILGVAAPYPEMRSWTIASGAGFSEQEVKTASKVALIGKTTSTQLFGEEQDPVGQIIRIKNVPFTVIGLLGSKGMNMMGSDQDDIIMVPWTSAMKRLTGGTTFRNFSVQADEADQLADVQQGIS